MAKANGEGVGGAAASAAADGEDGGGCVIVSRWGAVRHKLGCMCRPCKSRRKTDTGEGEATPAASPAATPLAASRIKSEAAAAGAAGGSGSGSVSVAAAAAAAGAAAATRPSQNPRARPWRPARRPPRTRIPPRRRLPASAARRLTRTPTPPSREQRRRRRRVRFGSLGFTLRPRVAHIRRDGALAHLLLDVRPREHAPRAVFGHLPSDSANASERIPRFERGFASDARFSRDGGARGGPRRVRHLATVPRGAHPQRDSGGPRAILLRAVRPGWRRDEADAAADASARLVSASQAIHLARRRVAFQAQRARRLPDDGVESGAVHGD